MELFQNSKKFKVGVNVLLAVQKMSKAALFRSNSYSNVNSEVNTPMGSPMPQQSKDKHSPRQENSPRQESTSSSGGGGTSEAAKEVTSPVSPKASAGTFFVFYVAKRTFCL